MPTVSFSDLRTNLATYLDQAEENREEIVVHRGKGRTAIILSFDMFLSLHETAYLMASPSNRRHLEQSMREAVQGKTRRVRIR
ncbi:MAG: type II toxin-antitoxin system prevent-host-death family antitoxin [Candidatus Peregrinibacteria bacterium]